MIAGFLKQIFGVTPANVSSTQTVDEYNSQTQAMAFPSTSGDETSNKFLTNNEEVEEEEEEEGGEEKEEEEQEGGGEEEEKEEEEEGGDIRFVKEEVKYFGTRNFGKTASPFLTQYLYGRNL
jgi:hypothetical protein